MSGPKREWFCVQWNIGLMPLILGMNILELSITVWPGLLFLFPGKKPINTIIDDRHFGN